MFYRIGNGCVAARPASLNLNIYIWCEVFVYIWIVCDRNIYSLFIIYSVCLLLHAIFQYIERAYIKINHTYGPYGTGSDHSYNDENPKNKNKFAARMQPSPIHQHIL